MDDPTFSTLEKDHTYVIYLESHFRTKPFTGPPFITANFINYKDKNRIARMRVVDEVSTQHIKKNRIHDFKITDFRKTIPIVDISTQYSIDAIQQERTARVASSTANNSMILKAIASDRKSKGTSFPVPYYLYGLRGFGGKKSNTRRRRR
jgi:hypothetical protein